MVTKKESAPRVRWLSAVRNGAIARKRLPLPWDTGQEVSRHAPYAASPELLQSLRGLAAAAPSTK